MSELSVQIAALQGVVSNVVRIFDDVEDIDVEFEGDCDGVLGMIIWHHVPSESSRVMLMDVVAEISDTDVLKLIEGISRGNFYVDSNDWIHVMIEGGQDLIVR